MDQWTDLEANENMIIKENNFRKAIKTRMLETQRERFINTPSQNFDTMMKHATAEDLTESTAAILSTHQPGPASNAQAAMYQTMKPTADKINLQQRPQTNTSNAYSMHKT